MFWDRNPFSSNIGYIGHIADRVSRLLNSGVQYTGTLWVRLDQYRSLEQRYEKAQKKIEEYRLSKDKFDFLYRQNKNLREILDLRPITKYPEIQTEILGIRLNSISPRIVIGKGKRDGIKTFMPVIARTHDDEHNLIRGLVGIVVISEETTSVVQPINHPGFQVGVRIKTSGEWAILNGNSGQPNRALLTYITSSFSPEKSVITQLEIPLKKNGMVYTSGAGGLFPPGIPVGLVSGVGRRLNDFKTAYVEPFVHLSELDYVSVILKAPEIWSQIWEQKLGWQEHLKTEFGTIRYPKIPKKGKLRRKAKRGKGKVESVNTKKNDPDKKKLEQNQSTGRVRRIQNVGTE